MRQFALFALLVGLACGCGKKPAPADTDKAADIDKGKVAVAPTPVDEATAWRAKQLAAIKGKTDARRTAIDELSYLVLEDPEAGPALLELLKDKGNNGTGQTVANQVNSTREAAAMALLKAGPKGEALLKDKGLAILRDGLSDPSPAVREHSAYTIAQLGPMSKPLAPDLQKLCTDKDTYVRGVAFDALRVTGVPDPVAFVKLLKHDNDDVVRLAGELIPLIPDLPAGAVGPLAEALGSPNTNIQTSAANGLAAVGPAAAPALPQLIAAINKYYPKEYDPTAAHFEGVENAYWHALTRIGEASVAPAAKLLEHSNMKVRSEAAKTLGLIGTPAKSAKEALKKALTDRSINVAAEAAVTLCILGEAQEDAAALIKRGLEAPFAGVPAYAIEAITRMGATGKPLVPLALAKIADKDFSTRLAVVSLVGALPPDEGAKYAADVGARATDEMPDIRRAAARVLARLGARAAPAADALGKALAAEKEPDIRDEFAEALLAMGAGAKPALPALLPLVAEKGLPAPLRVKAIAAVVVVDPGSAEVAAALLKAAADSEPPVRAAAARALGRLDPLPKEALDALVKMAKEDSQNGPRVGAHVALTTAGPRAKPARAEVEALTTNPQPALALWAKVALAAIDGDVSKSAPQVRTGLADRNPAVRASAGQALLVVGPANDDLPALVKLLKDSGSAARIAAATALGRLGAASKDAVPQLVRLLEDNESDVRFAAAEALGSIGPAALPAVKKLKELRAADTQVRTVAQWALDKIEAK